MHEATYNQTTTPLLVGGTAIWLQRLHPEQCMIILPRLELATPVQWDCSGPLGKDLVGCIPHVSAL